MGLPRKLKLMNLFDEGQSYKGEVKEVTLPKLARKTEDFRAGGMDGVLELGWTIGGHCAQALRQFGIVDVNGIMLRFAGAYQADDGSGVDAVEVVVRGKHKEIDRGNQKPGEDTETKITSQLAYYKETLNGETLVEIDVLNSVFMVDGVDRLAEARAAIGI
jgi:P2 family phage contractile tail tube protein